jgi:hypothetical protein
MEDPAEELIRRALGRRPPPRLGPTLVHDVLGRVTPPPRPSVATGWRAVPWLAVAGASLAVLTHLEWSSGTRAIAWGLALAMVPLTYTATLWPERALGLLALCGGPLLRHAGQAKPVTPTSPSQSRTQTPR